VGDDERVRGQGLDDGTGVGGERIDEPDVRLGCDDLPDRGIQAGVRWQPGNLNQTQGRHEPVLGQELQVERHERSARELGRNRGNLGGLGDQRHAPP
jgi:hypothetical protein